MAVFRVLALWQILPKKGRKQQLRSGDTQGDFGVGAQGLQRLGHGTPDQAHCGDVMVHYSYQRSIHACYLNLLTASGRSLTVPTMLYRFLGRISQSIRCCAQKGGPTERMCTSRQALSMTLG
jgi:hypothetical protein